jgi:hypothetical protein
VISSVPVAHIVVVVLLASNVMILVAALIYRHRRRHARLPLAMTYQNSFTLVSPTGLCSCNRCNALVELRDQRGHRCASPVVRQLTDWEKERMRKADPF